MIIFFLQDVSESQRKRRKQDGPEGAYGGTETFEAEGVFCIVC